MKRFRLRISGIVQGVAFRPCAKEEATRLGLVGFARNEPDGSVVIEAQGVSQALKEFLEWAGHGPVKARVDSVVLETIEPVAEEKEFTWS